MKSDGKPFFTLNSSVASNWIFLLCIVFELSLSRSSVMKTHNLDRVILMSFNEAYLLDSLISNYRMSIPMGSNQTRRQ